jgi:hypothetical protein
VIKRINNFVKAVVTLAFGGSSSYLAGAIGGA